MKTVWLDIFSTWHMIRATGIAMYFLLWLSVMGGLAQHLPVELKKQKVFFQFIHQHAGWLAFLLGFVHALLLLFDTYSPYTWQDIFLPFLATDQPVASGLGTLAFYCMALILLSSDLLKQVGKKVWRGIHYLSIPALLFALYHGYALGSDSGTLWAQGLYLCTAALLLFTSLGIFFVQRLKDRIR